MRLFLLLFVFSLLLGCSHQSIDDYQNGQPPFVLQDYFNGRLSAHGIVKNRFGKVIRTFNAELNGQWQAGSDGTSEGLLKEVFRFDDGEVQLRDWQMIATDQSSVFVGRAGDVVGDARLRTAGNALFIEYTLRIPYQGRSIDVFVDDRMYRVSDSVVINESRLSKWGIDVGEVVLTIIKHED
ncbi:MAG: DUF3833 domain-containing protein [Candidatus Pelagadaptatus aseana]|uniref:DUF3833 family protein n=1 Tax=Candidatus Pelagadaptatus aseana TaxID=3120508 RepID=UPI0039B269F4